MIEIIAYQEKKISIGSNIMEINIMIYERYEPNIPRLQPISRNCDIPQIISSDHAAIAYPANKGFL